MGKTAIEWTDETWNPIRGCSRISPGCGGGGSFSGTHGEQGGCYAEGIAARFSGEGQPFHGFAEMVDGQPRWTRKVALLPALLDGPLRRKKPTTYFISMSDLFHEALTNEEIAAVFGIMAAAHWHTFQVLTKRSARMREWFAWAGAQTRYAGLESDPAEVFQCIGVDRFGLPGRELHEAPWPLPNVHLGVSVESAKYKTRLDDLRACPAEVRFASLEPLLDDLGPLDLAGIAQVIAGAESGRGARPMHEDWVRSIRDQAKAQGVAFFYKQRLNERGHKVSLPMLDGRTWDEMPAPVPA
jgi:protein gp37